MNTELSTPTGDFERLEVALAFGADAVYLTAKRSGIGAGPTNFSPEELTAAVQAIHRKGTRVHMTCNTLPRVDELDHPSDLLRYVQQVEVGTLIAAGLGVMKLTWEYAPGVELHVPTQTGVVSHKTTRVFYEMGTSRMALAGKSSMDEVVQIRAKTPSELELGTFMYGSMCVSSSGRCLLSDYLTGQSANRGGCAQPCRWSYRLVEEKRLGKYFSIEEDDRGTRILNSRDMCIIRHIPELQKAGTSSLKIEGQARSAYYVAVTVNMHRSAIDFCEQHPGELLPERTPEELNKISRREYSTGFYFSTSGQVHQNGGYVRDYEVAAICEGWENGMTTLSQCNRFFRGGTVGVLEPDAQLYLLALDKLYDAEMTLIDAAPHTTMRAPAKTEYPIKPGALLWRMRGEWSRNAERTESRKAFCPFPNL